MDIFLLEDDEAIGIGLTYSLENEGYNVTLAKSVKEAEKIIDEKEFSLYILDLTLPDGSGYDVCKRIKAKGDLPVIFLTAMEYRLLLILLSNRGKVLSRTALLENIWDVAGDFVEDNTLTVYIKRLRDKIEEDPAKPEFIKTVRGLGYVIEK